jgi:hypothetical protein
MFVDAKMGAAFGTDFSSGAAPPTFARMAQRHGMRAVRRRQAQFRKGARWYPATSARPNRRASAPILGVCQQPARPLSPMVGSAQKGSLSGLSGIGYNYHSFSFPEKNHDYGPSLRHQT